MCREDNQLKVLDKKRLILHYTYLLLLIVMSMHSFSEQIRNTVNVNFSRGWSIIDEMINTPLLKIAKVSHRDWKMAGKKKIPKRIENYEVFTSHLCTRV